MSKEEISAIVVEYLLSIPEGTELTNAEAIRNCYSGEPLDIDDLFEIDLLTRELARKKALILDDSQADDTKGGLMFHVPYRIKRRRRRGKCI